MGNERYKLRQFVPLTAEERRVATLLVDGYPIPAIATIVGIGTAGVRKRITSVFRKFGTSQLVAVSLKLRGELPEFED